ncbi:MAG: translation initiation factor IF-2 [Baekduia sp.]
MAKKRIHEIAKAHDLTSKEVIERLQAAGIDAKSASSSVEEADAAKALGGAASSAKTAAPASRPAKAASAPPAGRGAPVRAPEGRGAPVRPPEGRGQPVRAPAGRSQPVRGGDRAQPIRPSNPNTQPARSRAGAIKRPGEQEPARPVPRRPAQIDDLPVDPRRKLSGTSAAPKAVSSTPAAPAAPEPEAVAEEPKVATEPVAETSAPEAAPKEKPEPHVEPPQPGMGPKIISVPEPPKRPKRDETQSQPGRGRSRIETGPGGKRRVVIDSQAARRGPGGPGGPGPAPSRPPRRRRRRRRTIIEDVPQHLVEDQMTRTDVIRINSGSNVKEVAEYLGIPVPEVIKKMMSMGELATLTKTLSDDHIELLASEFEKKIKIVHIGDEVDEDPVYEDDDDDLVEKPPVITIMGHVDHGKTSLLDAIRKANVTEGEAGGITQHIGAYQVEHNDQLITFLDTPGHQAFTAMRARGARVTDIAVIVVAADDGPRPQTDEAIDHARAADVPIVVAVNKVDKEGADPTRVRTQMTERGLQPSDWGGETEFVDVSAKAGTGLDDLLDTLLVVAELEELEANPDAEASGVVIESRLDPGRGPVVSVLVQRGTLRVGDTLFAGSESGRVRAMIDHLGERVDEALPGDPVEVLGFSGVPGAGEHVRVVENDREARRLAQEHDTRTKAEAIARRSGRKKSFQDVFAEAREADIPELQLIIKADVAGSVEALDDEIARLPQDEVFVDIISRGVGAITESDVTLASASGAVIMGFNVRPVGQAQELADREGVTVKTYSVIYQALDDLRAAMSGMLAPEEVEQPLGTVEVRQTFKASKLGTIAGSYVTDGVVKRGSHARIVRDGTVIADTIVATLRRFNDDAREVAAGYECGIVLQNNQDVQEGDILEVYETKQVERELQPL